MADTMVGRTFGRLVVVRQSTKFPLRYLCQCVCNATTIERAADLISGLSDSCGCLGRERWAKWRKANLPRGYQHEDGEVDSATHRSWVSTIARCANENATGYKTYGFAGVSVDPKWLGPAGYENFLADMGPRPPRTSVSRRLDSGNYEPGNCEWDSKAGQTAEKMGKKAMLRLRKIHAQNRAPKEK